MKRLGLVVVLASAVASADDRRCVDVKFTPSADLQIVAWIERGTPQASTFVDTVFITQQIGRFGLGNRPGRFDFNSAPNWPYGRRITTFPVWSHRNGQQFPVVMFQSDIVPAALDPTEPPFEDPDYCLGLTGSLYVTCGENNLSHAFAESSTENHYCKPLLESDPGWDTATCATQAFSDKGRFSLEATTGYPPRADLTRQSPDSASAAMFKLLNPYDAVSQPTPVAGAATQAPWPVPTDLPLGDYVLYVEVAKERDFNEVFSTITYPSPQNLADGAFGVPYRGQPSIVYTVPFTIAASATSASTTTYSGHGDPDGTTGTITAASAVDAITIDIPGSGASRLELVSDGGSLYRVRVDVDPKVSTALPRAPTELEAVTTSGQAATLSFLAPGLGTTNDRVSGYEIRIRAGDEMTPDNFADSTPVTTQVSPEAPGAPQELALTKLLPETDYWIGVRAFDSCRLPGDLAIAKLTTSARVSGSVDACFVATAAYGSMMATDVVVLRHFRDAILKRSPLGELGVETYYTFGPLVAGVIGESDLLRASARDVLAPIVARARRLGF